jgi:hypothetical protein
LFSLNICTIWSHENSAFHCRCRHGHLKKQEGVARGCVAVSGQSRHLPSPRQTYWFSNWDGTEPWVGLLEAAEVEQIYICLTPKLYRKKKNRRLYDLKKVPIIESIVKEFYIFTYTVCPNGRKIIYCIYIMCPRCFIRTIVFLFRTLGASTHGLVWFLQIRQNLQTWFSFTSMASSCPSPCSCLCPGPCRLSCSSNINVKIKINMNIIIFEGKFLILSLGLLLHWLIKYQITPKCQYYVYSNFRTLFLIRQNFLRYWIKMFRVRFLILPK